MACVYCISTMKFMAILLVIGLPDLFTGHVRSRRFPPFRLRRRRESSTLCTRAPQGALFLRAASRFDGDQLSNPVGTFLFSGASFMPAASAIVSISAAKSLFR